MTNTSEYDVVIVGAGPGGLRCAQVLGKAGKRVLLLEKNSEVGPKVCAGGLTRKAIVYLEKLGLPEDLIEQKFDRIVFRVKKWKTFIDFGRTFLYTIDRRNLGQWQLRQLDEYANVTVRTTTIVTKITKDNIFLNGDEKIPYDFLVGADGANSIVRSFLGIKTKMYGVAFQHIVSQKKYDDIEIILDSQLFYAWYAWIFPYDGRASVGTGYFPKIVSGDNARERFAQWLKKEDIDISDARFEAHPINCDYQGFHFDNIFLAGEAAGLASGFTGEGIYQALISGEEVAQKILDDQYESEKISELLREKKIQEILLQLLILAGPLRNMIFYLVVICVKIPFFGKLLLRILS